MHAWTGGIPRRINLLCNRLLLAAFLSDEEQITGALVRETASDLARETGGARDAAGSRCQRHASASVRRCRARWRMSRHAALRSVAEAREMVPRGPSRSRSCELKAPLMLLVDSPLGAFKAAVLGARRVDRVKSLPPTVLVTPGEPAMPIRARWRRVCRSHWRCRST